MYQYQIDSVIQDQVIKNWVDQIFYSYDTRGQGFLLLPDIANFFSDLFRHFNIIRTFSHQETFNIIRTVFPTFFAGLNRVDLYVVIKIMLKIPQNQFQLLKYYPPFVVASTNLLFPQFYGNASMNLDHLQYHPGQNYVINPLLTLPYSTTTNDYSQIYRGLVWPQ